MMMMMRSEEGKGSPEKVFDSGKINFIFEDDDEDEDEIWPKKKMKRN